MAKLTNEESSELSQLMSLEEDGVTLTPEQKSRLFHLVLQEREERDWKLETSGYQHDERGDDE